MLQHNFYPTLTLVWCHIVICRQLIKLSIIHVNCWTGDFFLYRGRQFSGVCKIELLRKSYLLLLRKCPLNGFHIPQHAVKDPSDYWLHIVHWAVYRSKSPPPPPPPPVSKCYIYLLLSSNTFLAQMDIFRFKFSSLHCGLMHHLHFTVLWKLGAHWVHIDHMYRP